MIMCRSIIFAEQEGGRGGGGFFLVFFTAAVFYLIGHIYLFGEGAVHFHAESKRFPFMCVVRN